VELLISNVCTWPSFGFQEAMLVNLIGATGLAVLEYMLSEALVRVTFEGPAMLMNEFDIGASPLSELVTVMFVNETAVDILASV
jgi:hypothetical protein